MASHRSCFSTMWRFLVVVGAVAALGVGTAADAAAIYTEGFDFDTSDFLADYPAFSGTLGSATAVVSGGVLDVNLPSGDNTQDLTRAGFAMPHTLSTLVGASNSNGNYNVGLVVGQNQVVFHPGYGGAALRVGGPGGFGNTNVGFTPANNVLHTLEVAADGTGNFNITLTDGANPANVFTTSFSNPGSVGGPVGVRRSGQPGSGFYDDLSVDVGPVLVYSDTFESDFALSGGDAASAGGQLILPPGYQIFTQSGPSGAYTVTGEVGADNSNGNYNVGLHIGQNNIVFHPGYGGAALRVEGPNGFGNTNVGFTPANNVLHTLEVAADGAGNFNITLTDGANPGNVFTTSFSNAGSIGGDVGFRRSGTSAGVGIYDELSIVPASGRPTLETFDNAFSTSLSGGAAAVVDGVLRLTPPGGANSQQFWNIGSLGDEQLIISAEVGAELYPGAGAGGFNVGLGIGQNAIVFHPGYSGAALRVDGPGGFGGQNVGFMPALDTLHLLQVRAHPDGLFEFTLTNRDDPTQVYSNSFFNPASIGGNIFLRRSGQPTGVGLFDNVVVQQVVPEPGSLVLLALGGLGLLGLLWKRRRS